ncbi:L-tyrosine/L-tryptophan isonitrile synthase family protein [Haliangium sp.]|uniref:L-tyrosine/L-tryptophan isonitrile synthase family protein n=1 Tax=Haliangium sp. TaxID=2663208 RepID=UPI003D13C4F4
MTPDISDYHGGDALEGAASDHDKATAILHELLSNRRLLPGEAEAPAEFEAEAAPHFDKVLAAIRKHEPLELVLPAFPAKSPNRQKTLGPLPDFAEKHALEQLYDLCRRIKAIHAPGAKLVICSDGRVFADLVRIPDGDVSAYGEHLREYARSTHGDVFDFFDLDDVFTGISDFDTLREELLICYGEALRSLRKRCQEDRHARAMYQGITRFIFEDYLGLEPFAGQSRTSVQKLARVIAYRVIQRSNAWSRLLADHFADAVRLSIHPQFRVSEKIGVYLGDADSAWTTPWHSVAVKEGGKVWLRKRAEVENGGAVLVFEDGRPSHYEVRADRAGGLFHVAEAA